jgi:hypothetical protein
MIVVISALGPPLEHFVKSSCWPFPLCFWQTGNGSLVLAIYKNTLVYIEYWILLPLLCVSGGERPSQRIFLMQKH